jgi:C_GCAxxG_C_C family probable redox protein
VNKTNKAAALFKEGFNCCQAVLSSFALELGLDRTTALRVASSFGGGMAQMGEVCGAVTGALMVLGLKYGRTKAEDLEAKERNYERVGEFVKRFKALYGSILCGDILGADMSTPEGRLKIKEKNLVATLCPKFVETAARILEDLLD